MCKADVRVSVLEYLKGTIIEEFENGDFVLEMHVPENERMWFSLLLGFGNSIKVLSPQEVVEMIKEKATEIQGVYQDHNKKL